MRKKIIKIFLLSAKLNEIIRNIPILQTKMKKFQVEKKTLI